MKVYICSFVQGNVWLGTTAQGFFSQTPLLCFFCIRIQLTKITFPANPSIKKPINAAHRDFPRPLFSAAQVIF